MNTELLAERLKLRLVTQADLSAIHTLHKLPETNEYNTLGIPKNMAETESIVKAWIEGHRQPRIKSYIFAVEKRADKEFIGLLGFRLGASKFKRGEVWYKIHPNFWRQGYATEALNSVIDFGFDSLGLHRIEAGCAVENQGSIKVLEKVGMTREGRGRQVLPLSSGWSDNYEYAIIDTDTRSLLQ